MCICAGVAARKSLELFFFPPQKLCDREPKLPNTWRRRGGDMDPFDELHGLEATHIAEGREDGLRCGRDACCDCVTTFQAFPQHTPLSMRNTLHC